MTRLENELSLLEQTIALIREQIAKAQAISYWRMVTSLNKACEDLGRLREMLKARGV